MAAGNIVNGYVELDAGENLYIQAGSGEEWTIHNIYWNGPCELYIATVGGDSIRFQTQNQEGAILGGVFHCTESQYLNIYNPSGASSITVAYDGIQIN